MIFPSRWRFRRVTNRRERQWIRSLGGYIQPNCRTPRTAAMHGLVLTVQTIGFGAAVKQRSNGNSAQSTYPNERMGEEMSRGQGYSFANDSGIDDESKSHPSPTKSISVTSNPMRKRALSESATQTSPWDSVAGNDHRDQMTQWSTPDLDQQQATENDKEEDIGGTTTTIPLLCNSCWCHWCQRPSEHCGPFSCTSPYIWCLGISREEMNATKLPDSIVRSLVAMGARTRTTRHLIQS
jgi:hypothetical protein